MLNFRGYSPEGSHLVILNWWYTELWSRAIDKLLLSCRNYYLHWMIIWKKIFLPKISWASLFVCTLHVLIFAEKVCLQICQWVFFVSVLRSEIFQAPIIRFSHLHIKNQPFQCTDRIWFTVQYVAWQMFSTIWFAWKTSLEWKLQEADKWL